MGVWGFFPLEISSYNRCPSLFKYFVTHNEIKVTNHETLPAMHDSQKFHFFLYLFVLLQTGKKEAIKPKRVMTRKHKQEIEVIPRLINVCKNDHV